MDAGDRLNSVDPLTLTTLVTRDVASGALKSFLEKIRREVSQDVEERQSPLFETGGDELRDAAGGASK